MPDPSLARALSSTPFARLGAFSSLFVDYASAYTPVAEYYAGDPRAPEARRAAAAAAAEHPRDRDALVDVLLDQNADWDLNDAARANIERLRDPASVAVVTGQQVGLFTGPLYTLYKTITAVQLARRLEAETGRPAVPVFWLEGEDHDFDEVAKITLLRGNEPVEIRYPAPTVHDANAGPVGRIAFGQEIEDVVDQVAAVLPPTDFKDDLIGRLRACYRPGETFRSAFARFMRGLFGDAGLVFISPDDARLKALAAPLFRREIEDHATSIARMRKVSDRLAADYHAQVHPRSLNLFMLEPEGRIALEPQDGVLHLRGTDRTFTPEALLDLLDAEPARFSPNVVLRPLVQDWLLPTAAYVAGPGEVAYFAQFKPVYDWAGVPMPVVYPRVSVTLVESKVRKVLDRYGLSVGDFDEDFEALVNRVVLDHADVDIDGGFKEAAALVHEAVNRVKTLAGSVDATLERSAESTRAALMKEFFNLKSRVVRAEKRNHDEVRAQLEKARVNLFPQGKMQERVLSLLYVMNKYGPTFPAAALEAFPLDTTEHHVLDL